MFCESMKGRSRQRGRTFFQDAHVTLSLTGASYWRVGKGRFPSTRTSPLPCQQGARMVKSPFLGTACAFTGHVVQTQQDGRTYVPKPIDAAKQLGSLSGFS
jgi:hypothetical protein